MRIDVRDCSPSAGLVAAPPAGTFRTVEEYLYGAPRGGNGPRVFGGMACAEICGGIDPCISTK